MWVRTQDKMQLVKINEIHIKVDEDGFVGIWVDDKKESLKYFLGTYKSKERALEVLDEIQRLIEDLKYMEYAMIKINFADTGLMFIKCRRFK